MTDNVVKKPQVMVRHYHFQPTPELEKFCQEILDAGFLGAIIPGTEDSTLKVHLLDQQGNSLGKLKPNEHAVQDKRGRFLVIDHAEFEEDYETQPAEPDNADIGPDNSVITNERVNGDDDNQDDQG